MINRVSLVITITLIALLSISCGSDSGPTDPGSGGGGGGGNPQPNPEGVLLEGDPASNGVLATRLLPPSAADQADIIDGLMTTRLIGMLSPTATVGEINQALTDNDVRIVAMTS